MAPPVKSVGSINTVIAGNILDESHGVPSHSQNLIGSAVGHPRHHVLCRMDGSVHVLQNLDSLGSCADLVSGRTGSLKSAFLTRDDQNRSLKIILQSPEGRRAINQLNDGQNEVVLKPMLRNLMPGLMMSVTVAGERKRIVPANSAVLILGHHVNKPEGRKVHIKTFYPVE